MERQIPVSVAITFYNQEQYIVETLSSVLKQKTDYDYEIVIGDDCSTDDSRQILSEFQRKYPDKIRIIFNETNLGFIRNLINVIDHCKGKYIALLDGDDFFLNEEKLQRQYDFLESNPDYGLVHSNLKLLIKDKSNAFQLIDDAHKYFKYEIKTGHIFEDLILGNFILTCTVLFRKDLYIKYADFDDWNKHNFKILDYPIWLALSRVTKFGYINEPFAVYRMIPNSVSRPRTRLSRLSFYASDFEVSLYFLNKYGVNSDLRSRFLNRYNLFYLEYGFESKKENLILRSIEYFKSIKEMKNFYYLYYWGSKSVFAWYMLKILRKVFRKLTINYYI